MPWSSSDRAGRLPAGWDRLRRFILRRDRYTCQVRMAGCHTLANQVDHILAGDDHSPENLQAICTHCHGRKSAAEGNAAKAAIRSRRLRPTERHPGRMS